MPMDNDTRGWILTGISGLGKYPGPYSIKRPADTTEACVFGASFICIDLVIRLFPSKRNFRVQESNGFLSCSLSLSAGVMVCRPCKITKHIANPP